MAESTGTAMAAGIVRPPRLVIQILVASLVLAAATAIARNPLPTWEEEAFKWIHHVPRWVDYAVWIPMQLGTAWAPLLTGVLAYWFTKSWRPTAGAFIAGWVGWWLAKAVKDWVERGRPFQELGAANVRDTALHEGLGFVSGHATVAFACAAILAPYLSRSWQWVVYLLAAAVGLSRVVVGAHLPLDAVGGACLGLILAWTWHLAVGIDSTKRWAR